MSDVQDINDNDLDNAFDAVSPITPEDDDYLPDVETDDTDDESDDMEDDIDYTPAPDDITDEEMALDGIEEDDLVVVNKDGSYVVMNKDIADILLSNVAFIDKLDSGFTDVEEFTNYVQPLLQGE